MKKTLITIAIVAVIVIVYGYSTYNSLVTLNVSADAKWKQVETEYQRRFDLVPNLVESVKGIMNQEQLVFDNIAKARTHYSGATSANDKATAATEMEGALGRLLVVAENYPQLKSSDSVQSLMSQIEGTENRISVERMRFNEAIQAYDLKVMRFPSSIVASIFGFGERQYFNSSPDAANAPKVKF